MAWVLLDDHFNDHPKAVQAGPEACWLFCCGLMYCRRHHTNGFIPHAAVATLAAVKVRSVDRLVQARLWETAAGGFRVHGYQAMYDDLDVKTAQDERRQQKRDAGKKGGHASWAARVARGGTGALKHGASDALKHGASEQNEAPAKQPASTPAEAHREGVGSGGFGLSSLEGDSQGETDRLDVAFRQFQATYPLSRRKGGRMIEEMYLSAVHLAGGSARLMEALTNHLASEQWQTPSLIPGMDTWLKKEQWRQRFDPPTAPVGKPTSLDRWAAKHGVVR